MQVSNTVEPTDLMAFVYALKPNEVLWGPSHEEMH